MLKKAPAHRFTLLSAMSRIFFGLVWLLVSACNPQIASVTTFTPSPEATAAATLSPTVLPAAVTTLPTPSMTQAPGLTTSPTPQPTETLTGDCPGETTPTPDCCICNNPQEPTRTSSPAYTSVPSATLNIASIKKITQAPPAQCPVVNPDLNVDDLLNTLKQGNSVNETQPVLNYLNQGGAVSKLLTAFTKSIKVKDLTGDGIPELMFSDLFNSGVYSNLKYYVLGCAGGAYRILLDVEGLGCGAPFLVSDIDMNLDGIPEVTLGERGGCGSRNDYDFSIWEWDGSQFADLISPAPEQTPYRSLVAWGEYVETNGGSPSVAGRPEWSVQDIDHNGTVELVLTAGLPTTFDEMENGPWRWEKAALMWNGQYFALTSYEVQAPVYRFQAAQDGDFATLAGQYDRALDLYQQVIFNDKLDWWSDSRSYYEMWKTSYGIRGTKTPTLATPAPDANEYPNLAAYAYYRIMLLYVIQGKLPAASTIYQTIQAKFPAGQPGDAFSEMATAFWENFQTTGSTSQACWKVIDVVNNTHADVMLNGLKGYQSHYYIPHDLCPYQ